MYWRTVFDGPFGLEATAFSNEYAIATLGLVIRGKPSSCSLPKSAAMVANSFSFQDGRSSWSRRPNSACSSPPRWLLKVHASTAWAPSSRPMWAHIRDRPFVP